MGCLPLLIRLHLLPSLLRRVSFLPYAYHVVVFFVSLSLLVSFCCSISCYSSCLFVAYVSLSGDDVLCRLLLVRFILYDFPVFFSDRVAVRFGFVPSNI